MDENKELRTFSGEIKLLERNSRWLYDVELWLLNDAVNRNGWRYEDMEGHKDLFCGTPLLVAYLQNGNVIGDGHNFRMVTDPETGEERASFTDATAERIVGALSENPNDIRTEERDGNTWIVGKGFLWEWYAPELVDKIADAAQQGRGMSVSIETLVTRSREEDGVEVEIDYEILGTTILGDHVQPAVKDARIVAWQARANEFKELKLRAASYSSVVIEPGNDEDKAVDDEIENKPTLKNKGVRHTMNKQAIRSLADKFEGYRVVGLSEDGLRAALVDDHGGAFTYVFNAEDKGEVISAKITPANVKVCFAFDEENVLDVDLADVNEGIVTARHNAEARADELQGKLDSANGTIESLRNSEHSRRVEAVNSIVDSTLAEICEAAENGDIDMSETAEGIRANAEKYASMEEDGKFCGDTQARARLMSAYAEAATKKAIEKKRNRNAFAWGDNVKGTEDDGGIEGMLSFING